jgi:2-isopropylmalate synthase
MKPRAKKKTAPVAAVPPGGPVIYDSTLRDGAQALGVTFSQAGKIRFAHLLDDFGIPYLEGGFAGSNERDMQFFRDAAKERFSQIRLVAFGATRRVGGRCKDDPLVQALLKAGTPAAAIYGKCWKLHVRDVLRTSEAENLDMVSETVEYLRDRGLEVVFDAEHFFDGYKDDPAYALEVLRRARDAGASALALCDTNGGTLPEEVFASVSAVREALSGSDGRMVGWSNGRMVGNPDHATKGPCDHATAGQNGPAVLLGVHAHNDCGLAVANSLAAYRAGARMVQGCMNGYGERAGNANLTTIVPALQLKLRAPVTTPEKLAGLRSLSLAVDDLVNQRPDARAPFVGEAAFSHKAGAHVSGVRRNPASFEHVPPEAVGNERHVVLSELSGASNVLYRLKQAGAGAADLSRDEVKRIVRELKQREAEGYSFESADASFRILVQKALRAHKPFCELEGFRVILEKRGGGQPCLSEATVKIRVADHAEITAGESVNGPVDALDRALRKALSQFYPEIAKIVLTDFRVRILDPKEATGATTRVLVESTDGEKRWGTVGVSPNIIEAAWQALLDSVEYKLLGSARAR